MDWIERWFDWAPDDGDGSFEVMILAALALSAVILVVALWPPARRAALRLLSGGSRDTVRR
jgi:hypothetical protein